MTSFFRNDVLPENLTFIGASVIKLINPAGNCMFKVNNRNTKARCEITSKLTIKTPE